MLNILLPLLLGLARAAAPQPSILPEGLPGPGPTVGQRMSLSEQIPGEKLSIAWAGTRLEVSDGVNLWLVDPDTGAVVPATLPPAPGPKKKSRKAPPPPPLTPVAAAVGPGWAAILALDTVWVFDPTTGAVRWKAPAGGATRVQWSADGTGVEGGGNRKHVVWSASSGTPLEAPDTRASLYSYSALLQRLAVQTGDDVLQLYDTTGVHTLLERTNLAFLAFDPLTKRLAAAGRGLWLWDAESQTQLLARDRVVSALAWSGDGTHLGVAVDGDEGLEIYDGATGAQETGVLTHGPVRGLTWTRDDTLLWIEGDALWRAKPQKGDLRSILPGSATLTALDAAEGWVAAGNAAGKVAVWGPDGALVLQDDGAGSVTALSLDVAGHRLAVRQDDDHLLDLGQGARAECGADTPACAALNTASDVGDPPMSSLAPGARWVKDGDRVLEAAGDELRVWGAEGLAEVRWYGADGAWARWQDGRYTWGAMDAALCGRGGPDERVLPPTSQSVMMVDRGSAMLFDGGPPVEMAILVTNTGPGPAYSVRVSTEAESLVRVEGAAARARLAPGERLLVPLKIWPVSGKSGDGGVNLMVRSLFGGPDQTALPVHVAPFPVSVDKAKIKRTKVKIRLRLAGEPAMRAAQVWLAAQGQGGVWTALSSGEAGTSKDYAYDDKPSTAILSDTLDLSAPGNAELEYRLPDKGSREVRLYVQAPGGSPVALPLGGAR